MNWKWLLWLTVIFAMFSCTASRFVEPLEHKQHAVTANIGGPMARVPGIGSIPLPISSIGYAYGLHSNATIYGNWHTTSAIFGVIQLELGTSIRWWQNESQSMGLSTQLGFHYMNDVFEKNQRLYPTFDANYYWHYLKSSSEKTEGDSQKWNNYVYGGMSNWFDLRAFKAHGLEQTNRLVFAPQIGHVFQGKHWDVFTEFKLLGPGKANDKVVIDYVSPLRDRGALGIYLGCTFKW